jgi:Kef-type K+ transport system membrane component KefB
VRWFLYLCVVAVVWVLRQLLGAGGVDADASALLALGLLMVGGELSGDLGERLRAPRVTAYLVLGMLLGPSLAALITAGDLGTLRLFEEVALGIIALTAGGEFTLGALARRWRLIVAITVSHSAGILILAGGALWLLLGAVPVLGDLPPGARLAAAALFGVIAVAKSPATTIAIITETRARGELVDVVLGVTILKDLVILLLFTWVDGLARGWVGSTGVDVATALHLAAAVVASLGVGLLLGVVLGLYLAHVGLHREITVLAVVLVSMELAHGAGLEHLLVCMAAGFAARNFFPRASESLVHALERSSPPIYVIFFALVGAGLDLSVFAAGWSVVAVLVLVRLVLVWGFTGGTVALLKGPLGARRYAWMGFVAQAGFSLGLAARIAREFPTFGARLATLIVGAVVINQLLGPILWRHALVASGEGRSDGVTE